MAAARRSSHAAPSKEGKHIDQNGQVFELPTYTMKMIHDAIPAHCFQPSILRSMAYVVRDYFYVAALCYAASYIEYIPNAYARGVAWAAYSVLQGFVFTGIWILAHECGHGAFSKNKRLNNIMGLIMHSFLLVPFHSWRISHSAHHKATGNIDKDTAFVPHVRESWVKSYQGQDAGVESVELSHLAEDAPLVTLWVCIKHQLFGWPGYLFANLTGQKYDKGFPQFSHFYFGEDSVLFKKEQLPLIMLSDAGVAAMIGLLIVGGQMIGSWNMVLYYMIPYLWVNHWIVAITFLQHTDGSLPHYNNNTWNFARGATATIDRDLGFIDTHLFHDIIGTHVCHHLVSTIPFYHAGEASDAIRKVMGTHYRADRATPFMWAFWKNQRACKFVEESVEGSGVYFYRNLHGTGEPPKDLTGGKAQEVAELLGGKKGAATTTTGVAAASQAKRRLSHSAQMTAKALPILVAE
ncbi:hypothetical protein VC83_06047 [Pseudogymnoascus destructans]|uniref:Fatty acid desaturase domain-containing protein n=2 Tax=Pseudogymnoascus destructans TaxID=655981 RepID=L8FT93_PSED2|nr:uncharacterized protein VC83_06047 [Pseudogymnoascus destructans]ELR03698.1 hypothetical protein GMDG_06332 [Pseudogymnoascus destructans 20631-21]OAF57023.1 hypothetical protein VC83_06047 [Pseudogymnoascus destructans]